MKKVQKIAGNSDLYKSAERVFELPTQSEVNAFFETHDFDVFVDGYYRQFDGTPFAGANIYLRQDGSVMIETETSRRQIDVSEGWKVVIHFGQFGSLVCAADILISQPDVKVHYMDFDKDVNCKREYDAYTIKSLNPNILNEI